MAKLNLIITLLSAILAELEVNAFYPMVNDAEWWYNQTTTTPLDYSHSGNEKKFKNVKPILHPLALSHSDHLNPQFITFRTRDSNSLQLDLNFGFPFLSVPIVNTSNIMNLAKDFSRRERPLINIDLQGITIVATMVVTALIISLVFRTFFAQLNPTSAQPQPQKPNLREETENELWELMETLNVALKKYGFDSGACMQRIVCAYVKNSMRAKESRGKMSHWNKIIEGLSRSDWAMDYVAGTDIEIAIKVARNEDNCKSFYKRCRPAAWFFKS